jgi:hypothetical protein
MDHTGEGRGAKPSEGRIGAVVIQDSVSMRACPREADVIAIEKFWDTT